MVQLEQEFNVHRTRTHHSVLERVKKNNKVAEICSTPTKGEELIDYAYHAAHTNHSSCPTRERETREEGHAANPAGTGAGACREARGNEPPDRRGALEYRDYSGTPER